MLNLIPQPKIIKNIDAKANLRFTESFNLKMQKVDNRIDKTIKKIWKNANIENIISDDGFFVYNCSNEFLDIEKDIIEQLQDKKEGYFLRVDENGIFVFSNYVEGLFYGLQTLKQIVEDNACVDAFHIIDYPDIEKRGMYFDFRITYPKFELLLSHIEMMAQIKTNCLIIEYEDKFPFETYKFLRHDKFCFLDEQLNEILEAAKQNFIEIIPLQQTFGHLEYVLKHPQFKHLRETQNDVGEMCPCKEEAIVVACNLIDDVIKKHPNSEYIHLGCDEVWSLCSCDACIAKFNGSREKLFIDFVNKLINYACSKGKKPIIWHDMLEKCSDDDAKLLDNRVNVMIWLYGACGIVEKIHELTTRFRTFGTDVSGASASRCQDGNCMQSTPKIRERLANTEQWVRASTKNDISFLVSTNWAAAGALAAPYGIYETSIYPMLYSAEHYWNKNSDVNSFLKRYIKVFHGVDILHIIPDISEYSINDIYQLLPLIIDNVTKNKDIAHHIKIVQKLEVALARIVSGNAVAYRYEMFKGDEGNITSLNTRIIQYFKIFQDIKSVARESLEKFLPSGMCDMYIDARYIIPEYLYDNFYKEKLVRRDKLD